MDSIEARVVTNLLTGDEANFVDQDPAAAAMVENDRDYGSCERTIEGQIHTLVIRYFI